MSTTPPIPPPAPVTKPAASPAPAEPPPRPFMTRVGRWMLSGFLLLTLLLVLYTWFTLWWSYSEGERAGVLQKFSKKGWICKTYEGEIALYIVGGIAPQIWSFTVRDAEIAEQLQPLVGRSVRLRYAEHVGVPTRCFGETGYFVTGFEIVDQPLPNVVVPGSSVAAPEVPEPASTPTPAPAPAPAPVPSLPTPAGG